MENPTNRRDLEGIVADLVDSSETNSVRL